MKAKLALGVVLAFACSPAALAGPSDTLVVQGSRQGGPDQRVVSFADLDLARPDHRRELHARVGLAIADLCDATRFSVADPHGPMTCRNRAWKDLSPALARLGSRMAMR